jgi:DNA-binding MarR family transcriptional regulator
MADLITALERRGLIVRRRDPANRRQLLISLTDAGRELLDEQDAAVEALEEQMLSGLSTRQRDQFRTYLNRCRAALAVEPPS